MNRSEALRQEEPDVTENVVALRRKRRTFRELERTFETEGWGSIDEMLAAEERKAQLQLEGAARTMEDIVRQRERLSLLRWFRALPIETRQKINELEGKLESDDEGEEA